MKHRNCFPVLIILVLLGAVGCTNQCLNEKQIELQNKETALKIFTAIESDSLNVFDTLIAADFIEHNVDSSIKSTGRAGYKEFCAKLKAAFPDARFDIKSTVAEDDRVMVYLRMAGTNKGTVITGMAPTGLLLKRYAVEIFKFKDGVVTEHWAVADNLSMMLQIGMMEMPVTGIEADSLK